MDGDWHLSTLDNLGRGFMMDMEFIANIRIGIEKWLHFIMKGIFRMDYIQGQES